MPDQPHISIVYLSYHSEPYLDEFVESVRRLTYPFERLELVVVDNPHPDHGSSMRALEERLGPLSGKSFPRVKLLPQTKNRGFAHGMNVGIAYALQRGSEYVYLHNDDGLMAPGALEPLVEAMAADDSVGAAQSLILLHPETHLVNSAGNVLHFCFFGYCDQYRQPADEIELPAVKEVGFASGAALLCRAELLQQFGGFDEDLALYCEDLEYSCRLRLQGYKSVVVRDSHFFHKYRFDRNTAKFYWLERNRHAVMLMMLRAPTLVLLAPMVLLLELALIAFAWRHGWLSLRLRVYAHWLRWKNCRLWLRKRRRLQRTRTCSDRSLLEIATARLEFHEQTVRSPLLRYVGNPILSFYYYAVIRTLVWW